MNTTPAAEPAAVTAARLAMAAVRSAEATREALRTALGTANALSVALPGWPDVQQADAALARVVDPHGPLRVLCENELRAYGETP